MSDKPVLDTPVPDTRRTPRRNIPSLAFHVPEPRGRPGDEPDFSDIAIPTVEAAPRPPESVPAEQITALCYGLIRVLDLQGTIGGAWNPHLSTAEKIAMMRTMMILRIFDDRMFRAQRQGKTSFYMKCLGEEATSVAAALALDGKDMCFPSYRQQGILIARCYPLVDMMNQIYSNRGDPLKGRQLPVLYSAPDYGFFSASGNLTTQYPHAVGWAMASAMRGDSHIAAAWCGEGSTAEGDFHAALTFAAVYNAPVIFNIINNQWAISSYSAFAGGERTSFAARALGYGIAGLRVDGNDPLAVYAATRWAAARARANGGATVIEHFTYRVEGHSTSDDPAAYRPQNEAAAWPLGDPIVRLRDHLIADGDWDQKRDADLQEEITAEVKAAQKQAEKFGILGHGLHHEFETMFEGVFAEMPWHLREQCNDMLAEQKKKFGSDWKPR